MTVITVKIITTKRIISMIIIVMIMVKAIIIKMIIVNWERFRVNPLNLSHFTNSCSTSSASFSFLLDAILSCN